MSRAADALGPFRTGEQKRRADTLGMFVFLASELMLFGALVAALLAYRVLHKDAAAQAAQHLNLWLGTANTAMLLTSSLLVALGAETARAGRGRTTAALFAGAAALGTGFLVVKGCEYRLEYLDGLMPGVGPPSPLGSRPASLFISLYFVSTALHALHVCIGIGLLGWTALGVATRRLPLPQRRTSVELVGLYWHLVDVIWVFLFPLLYLARM